jgi:hypothetical protein
MTTDMPDIKYYLLLLDDDSTGLEQKESNLANIEIDELASLYINVSITIFNREIGCGWIPCVT